MIEMVTPGSMSGKGKRSGGLLGERGNKRRCVLQAPPAFTVTALLLDCTDRHFDAFTPSDHWPSSDTRSRGSNSTDAFMSGSQ
jgi:hypothetical protein